MESNNKNYPNCQRSITLRKDDYPEIYKNYVEKGDNYVIPAGTRKSLAVCKGKPELYLHLKTPE
jgi:hypothetical protein